MTAKRRTMPRRLTTFPCRRWSCSASTAAASRRGHGFGRDHAEPRHQSRNPAAASTCWPPMTQGSPRVPLSLPVGRVHATGRTFVPFIPRDLYDKLVAAAPNGNAHRASPPASGRSGGSGSAAGGSPPNLPKTWQEISLGDLVVAQEGPEDGWYEAIVAEVNGDMLTLRWRDYPRERRSVQPKTRRRPMNDTTKIGASHLSRAAYVYLRQSSPARSSTIAN